MRGTQALLRCSPFIPKFSPPKKNVYAWTKLISERTKAGRGREALKLYHRMREEGLTPNNYAFVAVLKACCSIRGLEAGKEIHAQVRESGHESDIFVSSSLVIMYAKCGSITDARQVFDEMKYRNVVSWNAIITAYTILDMEDSALHLYEQMLHEGYIPDSRTFLAALKACSNLQRVRDIHAELAKRGFESDVFISSTLIDMYAKCGSITDASRVFEKMMHRRNVVSWTAMMIGYVHMELGDSALELYERMKIEGFTPNAHTFVAALKACGSLAAQKEGKGKTSYQEQGRRIHVELAKSGLESNVFVASTLVDMYAKCGAIEDARQVFEKMSHRDVVSWNAIIIGYTQMEMGDLALELYTRMQNEGFRPDERTFIAALKACTTQAAHAESRGVDAKFLKTHYLYLGRSIHTELAKRGCESDIFVANTLVDMYAKCGSIQDAHQVFENVRHRDVVSWNTMVIGYAQVEMGDFALQLYDQMKLDGFIPDAHTFVAALKACGSLAAQAKGRKSIYLEQGRAIHCELTQRGFEASIIIANALVDMYVKCGSIEDACQVFEKMSHRDVVSWTSMIIGYTQMEMGQSALNLYLCMQKEGFSPNAHTFVAALKACSSLGSLEVGKEIHSQIHRLGLQEQSFVANSLIDMYGKCGNMEDAQEIFNSLLVRDSVTWNALLAGYSGQGNFEHSFNLYKRMVKEGIIPNGITFVSILSVCSHHGLVYKGQMYFQAMRSECGISPSSAHYMCMVDLLGRAGQLDIAVAMLRMMPFGPDKVTWMTILGACRMWNNVETGRNAFECVVVLDEKFVVAYVLMMNIYESARMWGESTRIQEMLKLGQYRWAESASTFFGGA